MQATHTAESCFVTYLLDRQEEYGLSDDELAYLAGSMFGAGSDTVCSLSSQTIMLVIQYEVYTECKRNFFCRDGCCQTPGRGRQSAS